MIKLYDEGVYLVHRGKIIPEGSAEAGNIGCSKEEASRNTIAYDILSEHNTSNDTEKLKIKFDKLTSHETGTWTPQPQGDKAPPPALPPRAEEVKLVGGLRSSVAVVQSPSMEPFRAMWAMERPRLSGQGHRHRSGADSGSVCPGAGRRTALCVRFLTRAVWRVCSS